MPLSLDYYYGNEAEQYNFYRIPKTLFTDPHYKSVSIEAKVLYGLLLDRMSLSVRNGWLDDCRRVYIYFTLEDAMEMMACGKDKAVKLFKELDKEGGIGLIERKKQGLGRPARIYVKNFVLPSDTPPSQTSENPKSRLLNSAEVQTSEKSKSRLLENRSPEVGKPDPNKTERNKTEMNETDLSIPLPPSPPIPRQKMGIDEMDSYREILKKNIDYPALLLDNPFDRELIDGYVELMAESCCSKRAYLRVSGEELPVEVVQSRLLKLTGDHIRYVVDCLRQNTTRVGNIRAYMLAALYNAPVTMGPYYTSQVSHDMAAG
ncbi:MAG: replication initiator protein A [Provencibacterium sp.]|nr:replication initiator protein A [Provencibacterium sp.]